MNLMSGNSDTQSAPYNGASSMPSAGLAHVPLHTPLFAGGDAFMRAEHWGSRKRSAAEMFTPSESKLLAMQRKLLEEMLRADAAEVSGTDQEDEDRSKKEFDDTSDDDTLAGPSSESGVESSGASRKPRRKKPKVESELCVEMVSGGHHELRMRRKPKAKKATTRKRRTVVSRESTKKGTQGIKVSRRKPSTAEPGGGTAVPGSTTPSAALSASYPNADTKDSDVNPLGLQNSSNTPNNVNSVYPMGLHNAFSPLPSSHFSFVPPVEVPASPVSGLRWGRGDHESKDDRDRCLASHFEFGVDILDDET